jgi:hypothetical protein
LVVTHPFHALCGKQVQVLYEGRDRWRRKVYICDAGPLGIFMLPEDFTDRASPGPVGKSPVDADLLSELATLVTAIRRDPLTKDRCK